MSVLFGSSDPSSDTTRSSLALGYLAGVLGLVCVALVLVATTVRDGTAGAVVPRPLASVLPLGLQAPDAAPRADVRPRKARPARPHHPSRWLSPYFTLGADLSDAAHPDLVRAFHDVLGQFTRRQAIDGNFTVRVIDNRTHETLEVYELTDLRALYDATGSVNWEAVDDERRAATERLVDKYEARGVPNDAITVRWGRAHQVARAHERDVPYNAYEIQLARALDLSLLASEIGTVETFNQDDRVSPAGAQSRYQMMPWILRKSGVHAYRLYTASGTSVWVEEELHPLLTLEPAFRLLRGYVNAVGHELPGLSAYHTGPGTIFALYRLFYTESDRLNGASTVADAYVWALTEGFDVAREETLFGPYSRSYVPSLHGALKAHEQRPPDTTATMRAARVQLRSGTSVTLDQLLGALRETDRSLEWAPAADPSSLYARFRALNPHLHLPAPSSSSGGVPAAGNVRLVASVDGQAVRFFLPLQAPAALRAAGLDVLEPEATFRFDGTAYTPPTPDQRTMWDARYATLVDDIGHFGFTPENRERLLALHDKFAELAEQTPSAYRRRQLDIIQTHRRLWQSAPWEKLSALTLRMTGRRDAPALPPEDLSLPPTPSLRLAPPGS